MISIINTGILLDHKTIFRSPDVINIAHIFNEKILFLYQPYSLIPETIGFQRDIKFECQENLEAVNRNILMIDFNGNVLWQIQSSAEHYNPWTLVATDYHDKDRWYVSNSEGYQFDIDISTGQLSNQVFSG